MEPRLINLFSPHTLRLHIILKTEHFISNSFFLFVWVFFFLGKTQFEDCDCTLLIWCLRLYLSHTKLQSNSIHGKTHQ